MNNRNVEKLHPVQLVFLGFMLQTTLVVFSLPRQVAEAYGTNGWIMLFIYSLIVTLNIYLFQLVYNKGSGASAFSIMNDTLPMVIRAPIYIIIAVFFTFDAVFISKQYVYLIQLVTFSTTPAIYLLCAFMIAVLLFLANPVYKMVRIAGVLFGLAMGTLAVTVFVWNDFSFSRLTPFLFKEAAASSDLMSKIDIYLPFLSYEICFFLFPYVTAGSHLFRSFYLGNALTTLIYVYTTILCFGFYSFEQVKHILYPTLNLFSYIEFPFLIRIENLVHSVFLVTALVTVVFNYWVSTSALKEVIKVKGKWVIPLSLIVLSVVLTIPYTTRAEMEIALQWAGRSRTVLMFFLPLLMLFLIFIKKKVKR
ncbi:GerAB/ArcD/ProY family transporter [Salibacterium aidingense]|uniref:GerAB/ArcD/ProY family transporter n=1 Tax=Salibacterium aidingense TaxID=384933 RepID=UPI003BCDFDBE